MLETLKQIVPGRIYQALHLQQPEVPGAARQSALSVIPA
jgi:hypothetical protein